MILNSQITVVKPSQAHLIVYGGGYGGEFIGHWLSQHQCCIPAQALPLANNRYVNTYNRKFKISDSDATTNDLLFLLSHPGNRPKDEATTFNGIPVTDIQNISYIDCSQPYKKFFFLMMWLKMRLYKFSLVHTSTPWHAHIFRQFNSPDHHAQFRQYINGRDWCYQFEITSFINNEPNAPVIDRIQIDYADCELPRLPEYQDVFVIDLDQLLFGNSDQEHQRLCNYYGMPYTPALTADIEAYHQRNLDLYSRYINIPIDEFIGLSQEAAWPYVAGALTQYHSEPVIV